ncbi:hypothetical protein OBBRIDRAFT_286684 [Obba rivulosa]|uniref:Uncharacterized protein n=1 Tax=Obba rivulosa TaxID=1052685 RepID=A0A8E2APT3_9APHY|nr:hypothetical protein OBBRIDRAFT_286684 [Obba rivulosa]
MERQEPSPIRIRIKRRKLGQERQMLDDEHPGKSTTVHQSAKRTDSSSVILSADSPTTAGPSDDVADTGSAAQHNDDDEAYAGTADHAASGHNPQNLADIQQFTTEDREGSPAAPHTPRRERSPALGIKSSPDWYLFVDNHWNEYRSATKYEF